MDIPAIEFREAVTGELILPESHAASVNPPDLADPPDLDDLGLEECPECGMDKPLDTRCPCGDCETCGGDGTVRRSNGRTTDRYPCKDCGGTGRVE